MPKLRSLSGKEVCAILAQHGFARVRQRGSHIDPPEYCASVCVEQMMSITQSTPGCTHPRLLTLTTASGLDVALILGGEIQAMYTSHPNPLYAATHGAIRVNEYIDVHFICDLRR